MSNSSSVSSITDAQIRFGLIFARSCTIPGTCVCFLVLAMYGVVAWFPKSRQQMDRVSFRILTYALICHVLFGIVYAAAPNSPGARCNFAAFFINLFVCLTTFFTTCIAINLQLVVVHHVNGQQMEKYYIIGSILLTIVFNVPTFALGQFGWDESASCCWYKNPDPATRLRWMIGTQSFPLTLSATLETICSCIILVYMYLVQRSTKPFCMTFTISGIKSAMKATKADSEQTKHLENQRRSMNITQHPRYRKVILRIVLYPIVSLLVNFLIVVLDLNSTIRGVNTQLDFRLIILGKRSSFLNRLSYSGCSNAFKFVDLSLTGLRMLPYGLLAAVDPIFISAMRELLGKNRSESEKVPTMAPTEPVAENIQISLRSPQGETILGAETQSGLDSGLTSSENERISNVFGESMNEDEERSIRAKQTGQDLEIRNQYDHELESPGIEKQL